MNTTTTSETINLADYFFKGSDFNWENVNLTIEKWGSKFPGEEDIAPRANADSADEDEPQFWIEYQNVELVFRLGVNTIVQWCPMNGADFDYTDSDVILPRDPAALLRLLKLADHPDAKDIPAFWLRLQKSLHHHLEGEA